MKQSKKVDILNLIYKYIERDFVYDYDSYEEFPVIDYYDDLNNLDRQIAPEDKMTVLSSLAVLYVNLGIIYAKSHLSESELANYLIFWVIDYDADSLQEFGFCIPEIFYTKKAKECFILKHSDLIDIKKDKLFPYISNLIGIEDFECYHYPYADRYYFVPKIMRTIVPDNFVDV